MRDLQAIRADNAMTFTTENWYVEDATGSVIADCSTQVQAKIIAQLLNEYAKIQAAGNRPLWPSPSVASLGSMLDGITERMDREDKEALEVLKRNVKNEAPIGTQGKTIWPVDPGYAAWIDHKAHYEAQKRNYKNNPIRFGNPDAK